MSNLEYWIWFAGLRLRDRTRAALLERWDGPKELYFAEKRDLEQLEGLGADELSSLLERDLERAAQTVNRCGELGVGIVTMQDAAYPERLRNIPDPPAVLYVWGTLPALDAEVAVAVVGTRKSSVYGNKMARTIAYELTAGGGIVVTGLAAGIDGQAAEGALMAGGPVMGVLGVGINQVYPQFHARLYEDVRRCGALLSEYPPDAKGSSSRFPRRNRIMAGLSVAAVVVEAPAKSGALITAHRALDYGRDVFAVPGNAGVYGCAGSNNLLREGALLAENGRDILKEYAGRFPEKIHLSGPGGIPAERAVPEPSPDAKRRQEAMEQLSRGSGFWKFRAKGPAEDSPVEDGPAEDGPAEPEAKTSPETVLQQQLQGLTEPQLALVSVLTKPSMHVDDIVEGSGLSAAVVLSELTLLQIKGYVTQEPGKRFTLNINRK